MSDPTPDAAVKLSAAPAGHAYHLIDGLGGQWLCETTDEYPEPTPIGLLDDILTDAARTAIRADHFQHLYEQASEGRCGYSGLTIGACKASICDCFDFPWVKPAPEQHPDPAPAAPTPTEDREGRPVQGCMACATYRAEGRACPNHRAVLDAAPSTRTEGKP